MGEEMIDTIVVNNSGGIFSDQTMRVGFKELQEAAAAVGEDYLAAEIRLHPLQLPNVLEYSKAVYRSAGGVSPTADRWAFAGVLVYEDPSMPDDEIQVRDRNGKLLIRLTNLGKPTKLEGENNAT